MTLSDLEVVRVVSRCDLNDAGTEFSVYPNSLSTYSSATIGIFLSTKGSHT